MARSPSFAPPTSQPLREIFVQLGLIAQRMDHLTLVTLGYDGTCLRTSSRRNGTQTPDELRRTREKLANEFAAHYEANEKAQAKEDFVLDATDNAAAADLETRGKELQL